MLRGALSLNFNNNTHGLRVNQPGVANDSFWKISEPTFRPSGATNHWKKHSVSRLSYLFAHLHLLISDFLHLLSSPF